MLSLSLSLVLRVRDMQNVRTCSDIQMRSSSSDMHIRNDDAILLPTTNHHHHHHHHQQHDREREREMCRDISGEPGDNGRRLITLQARVIFSQASRKASFRSRAPRRNYRRRLLRLCHYRYCRCCSITTDSRLQRRRRCSAATSAVFPPPRSIKAPSIFIVERSQRCRRGNP